MKKSLILRAVGDVAVNRPDPRSAFALVKPVFDEADVVFANCESTYSDSLTKNPAVRGVVNASPEQVDGLTWSGIDVVSFANNHHMDGGYEGFFATLEALRAHRLAVCGAGADLEEARRPAVIEREDVRVAFLAYSSILYPGFEANVKKPGCVPINVHTHYAMSEVEQPGSPADVRTFVDPESLRVLREDIERARAEADVVVVSAHWGLHFVPVEVADYESEFGRAAIDAGADLVLGHHQHLLKAVEVYRGRVIFHGLGNFIMDTYLPAVSGNPGVKALQAQFGEYGVNHYDEYPSYPFHPDARQTVVIDVRIENKAITSVSFIPCLINREGQPEPLSPDDQRYRQVVEYQEWATREAGFPTRFRPGPSGVVIETVAISN